MRSNVVIFGLFLLSILILSGCAQKNSQLTEPNQRVINCGEIVNFQSASGTPGQQCTDRNGIHTETDQCDGDNLKTAHFGCNADDLCAVNFQYTPCNQLQNNYTCKTSDSGSKYCAKK